MAEKDLLPKRSRNIASQMHVNCAAQLTCILTIHNADVVKIVKMLVNMVPRIIGTSFATTAYHMQRNKR